MPSPMLTGRAGDDKVQLLPGPAEAAAALFASRRVEVRRRGTSFAAPAFVDDSSGRSGEAGAPKRRSPTGAASKANVAVDAEVGSKSGAVEDEPNGWFEESKDESARSTCGRPAGRTRVGESTSRAAPRTCDWARAISSLLRSRIIFEW